MTAAGTSTARTVLRILIIAACGMTFGYLFYGSAIFVPADMPFQFTLSSVTAALFIGLTRESSHRTSFAGVLIWYLLIMLFSSRNNWILILGFVYLALVAAAMYVSLNLVRRPPFDGILKRVVTFAIAMGVANFLAVAILSPLSALRYHGTPGFAMRTAMDNFEIGTMIGIGIGAGVELSGYLLSLTSLRQFIGGGGRTEGPGPGTGQR